MEECNDDILKEFKSNCYSSTVCKGVCKRIDVFRFNNNLGAIVRYYKDPNSGSFYSVDCIFFDGNYYFDIYKQLDLTFPKQIDDQSMVIDILRTIKNSKERKKYGNYRQVR